MPLSNSLIADLREDLDSKLPLEIQGQEPCSLVLVMPGTAAPGISVSRDRRLGKAVVPHYFLTMKNPELLWPLIGEIQKMEGMLELFPLVHSVSAARTKEFLIIPFLFNSGRTSSEFIHAAKSVTDTLANCEFEFAAEIVFCHLSISTGGKSAEPEQYPVAFDHVITG
jgi:hypothetical protein